ncbi:MAG: hypothetical protein M0031_02965 [Thermaerobacter sp.]|jgi:hypothetical protein|nr:hypothetical protein [Thermaerobacter sp.]
MDRREFAAKSVADCTASIRLILETMAGPAQQLPVKVVLAVVTQQGAMYRDLILRARSEHRRARSA